MQHWIELGVLGALALGTTWQLARTAPEGCFFCALNALSPEERQQHEALTRTLRAAVQARRPVENGYAFALKESVLDWEGLTRWVALERRCCPFFRFRLDVAPDEDLVLELTGAPGVKRFIEAEVGSGPT